MDDKYTINFDGVSSEEAGVIFLSPLKLSAPVPRIKKFSVPGRNGDIYVYDGSFENRTATVQACLYSDELVKSKFAKLNEWLFSSFGYKRLVTADDPEHYLLARVVNGPEIVTKATNVAPFTIKFDCKPQRFLKDSFDLNVLSQLEFVSKTSFDSKPLLEISYSVSSGSGSIILNGIQMTIDTVRLTAEGAPSVIYYDTETERTYSINNGLMVEYVDVISGAKDIVVKPGTNLAMLKGDISSAKITPRGWNL